MLGGEARIYPLSNATPRAPVSRKVKILASGLVPGARMTNEYDVGRFCAGGVVTEAVRNNSALTLMTGFSSLQGNFSACRP